MRFLTERGQNVNGQPNIIYVSTDNGATWFPLHEFVDVRTINTTALPPFNLLIYLQRYFNVRNQFSSSFS